MPRGSTSNILAIEEEPTTNHGVRTLHPCRFEEGMGDGHMMAADAKRISIEEKGNDHHFNGVV